MLFQLVRHEFMFCSAAARIMFLLIQLFCSFLWIRFVHGLFFPHVILICSVDYNFVPFIVTYFADYNNLFLFVVIICSSDYFFVPHVILICSAHYIFVPFVVMIYFADYKNLFLFVVMICSPCNLDCSRRLYFCSLCSHDLFCGL
jgi:hypothetical protein